MEPRKKDVMDYAIPIIGIIVAMFLSLHMAISYEAVKDNPVNHDYENEQGEIVENRTFNYGAFFSNLGERITERPNDIHWVDSTPKFLLGAGFVCLIAIGYMVTSTKKFINGKEYGTSEWGSPKQIAHLHSSAIKKAELKKAKKNKKKRKEIEEKYKSADIIFTQTEKICMYNFELNNNTMIIGGSGSGKTRGYVLPNILQCNKGKYSPSLVITDPKGEILMKVGKYLTDCGYEIRVLNLKEQNRSFCFNPFKYILEEKYEESISSLVSCIMDSKGDNKEQKSNDPFWEDMAKILLKAVFYAVYEGFPMEERNMPTVMELFRWFEVSDEDNRDTKLDKFFEVFGDKYGTYQLANTIRDFYIKFFNDNAKMVKDYRLSPQYPMDIKEMGEFLYVPIGGSDDSCSSILKYEDEIVSLMQLMEQEEIVNDEIQRRSMEVREAIHNYIDERQSNYANSVKPIGVVLYQKYGDVNTNPALRNWEDFRTKCKGRTAQSVTSTALAKLAPFDEEQIRRIFSKDEMELDLVGERKTALFIVLPPTGKTYNFIANVLYTQLFEQLEYCATVKHNQQLPVPVRFILDEFYNTGRIPNFENILSYARSFGIGISIILQSLDQIKEMYEKSWGTVLDNCSTFLYLGGIRHYDTLKYISDLLGKGTFDKKTYSRTKGRQSSSSTSYDKIGRELLDPSEIQRMNKKKCLLFVSGYNPYISQKFNYKTHKNYKYTSDSNKKNIFYYQLPKSVEEDNKLPHREEVATKVEISTFTPKRERTASITVNTNQDEILKMLQDNILGLDFDSGEEVALSSNESEELELLQQILFEEEAEEEKAREIRKKFTTPVEVKTDVQSIAKIVTELVDNKDTVDLDTPVELGESAEDIEIDDSIEFNDDTVVDMDSVEMAIDDLTNDMIDSGFLDELDSIDLGSLETGEVNEIETAETA